MACVYIIYSASIDRFYIGSCLNLQKRVQQHLNKEFENAFTHKADDWNLFYQYDGLEYKTARKIENHIKKMKSQKYNHNLRKYDEIMIRLIQKYNAGSSR